MAHPDNIWHRLPDDNSKSPPPFETWRMGVPGGWLILTRERRASPSGEDPEGETYPGGFALSHSLVFVLDTNHAWRLL